LLVVKYANLDQVLVVDSIRVEGTKVIGNQIEESGKTDHILGTYASAALAKAAIPSLIVSPSMENAPIVEAKTDNTAGNLTITAAMVLAGILERDPAAANRSDVFPTAELLVAAIPNAFVGKTLDLLVVNTADAAETIAIAAGTGGTLKPGTPGAFGQNKSVLYRFLLTNVSAGTEAYTVYAVTGL
jgi:hypothetical protein